MHMLPTYAARIALTAPVAGDAVADAVEAAQLLDVEMDHVAGVVALVAACRGLGFDILHAAEPRRSEHAADGGGRDADDPGDLVARHLLPAQRHDLGSNTIGRRMAEPVWPGRTVRQTGRSFGGEPRHPLADRPRADGCGSRYSRQPLPAHDAANDRLSTKRRGSRILVNVHPGSPDVARVSQHQSPTADPDGQPVESSHLEKAI
jgi:hypothetical protein